MELTRSKDDISGLIKGLGWFRVTWKRGRKRIFRECLLCVKHCARLSLPRKMLESIGFLVIDKTLAQSFSMAF